MGGAEVKYKLLCPIGSACGVEDATTLEMDLLTRFQEGTLG